MAELLPDGLVVVGRDRRIRFVNAEALRDPRTCDRADARRHAPSATSCPLHDNDGRDWWAHTDPWGGLATRTGHREKLLVGPERQRGARHRALRPRRPAASRSSAVIARAARRRGPPARRARPGAALISTVAHELRSPLTSVKGFSAPCCARWDRFTDEQKRLMLETIEADADRVTRLITELLDISRIDAGRLDVRRSRSTCPPWSRPARRALEARRSRRASGSSSVDARRRAARDVGRPRPARPDPRQPDRERRAPRRRHGHGDPRPRRRRSATRPSPSSCTSTTRATASARPTASRSSAGSGTGPPTRAPASASTSCGASSRRTAARHRRPRDAGGARFAFTLPAGAARRRRQLTLAAASACGEPVALAWAIGGPGSTPPLDWPAHPRRRGRPTREPEREQRTHADVRTQHELRPVEVAALDPASVDAAVQEALAAIAAAALPRRAQGRAHRAPGRPQARSPWPTARSAPCRRAPRPRPASASARPAAASARRSTARQAELEAERDERILVEEARRRHPAGAAPPARRAAPARARRPSGSSTPSSGWAGRSPRAPRSRREWLNFDALNLGPDHPARQMQDTFFVDPADSGLVLRTQTSPVQIRTMLEQEPPIYVVCPGQGVPHRRPRRDAHPGLPPDRGRWPSTRA